VQDALASPHANYVLQVAISGLPSRASALVARELRGHGAFAARHRFGCRVLCRLVEHAGTSSELAALLEEVLAQVQDLCRGTFSHYVVRSVLEHLPAHRARIAEALHSELTQLAQHRCASHVVEAALLHCDDEDRRGLALELLGGGSAAVELLAQSQYGSFVLKALLRVPCEASQRAQGHLRQLLPALEGNKHSQRMLRDLGLKP